MNRTFSIVATLLSLSAPLYAENWPQFRGPTGQGISVEKSLPLKWDSMNNIAWKTPIPGDSWSSPIVSGEQVFLTTATENGASCRVISLDRHIGKILWDKEFSNKSRAINKSAIPSPRRPLRPMVKGFLPVLATEVSSR